MLDVPRSSFERFCDDKLAALTATHRRRTSTVTRRLPGLRVERGDAVLVDFSSNDSLALAHEPRVLAAAAAALVDGAGSGGSRLVSGAHRHLHDLEAAVAAHKGTEAALVVGSGWLANVGVIPALVGSGAHGPDTIVVDALAHASLMTGVRLAQQAGAVVVVVAHNDLAAFAEAVSVAREQRPAGRILLVTESVFSMDGDLAPLAALRALCELHDAWLLVDDAHGFLLDLDTPAPARFAHVVTGTLSKAAGSYGGTIAGPASLCALLLSRARPVLFGTSLPPSVVAAAHAAVQVAELEPDRRRRPLQLAKRLCAAAGLPVPTSQIVPVVVGDEREAMQLMQRLADDGFLVVAIRPPTVAVGTSRLRIAVSAGHSDDDIDGLAASLCRHWTAK